MAPAATVLHVDDDPGVLELSEHSFERTAADSVELITASSAEEGLSVVESRAVDCIVSDSLRLSDDTAFIVAARERASSVPIVFYTAKEWGEVAVDALEACISAYVRKGEGSDVEAVVERAAELAHENRTPTIERGSILEGREYDSVEDAVEQFPAEVADGEWTVVGVHDWQTDEELGTTIAQSLETHTGLDARQADPLFEAIDAEALEALLEPRSRTESRHDIHVRFPYGDAELSVSSEGFVAIRDLSDEHE